MLPKPHPYNRKGTSRNERFPKELAGGYVKIDERNLVDLISQTAELSKYFNYFELSAANPDGNWSAFFEEIYDFETGTVKIKNLEDFTLKANATPHLALLLTFLQLFTKSIEHLNSLSDQHLMFFYEKMLRLKPKPAQASKVTLTADISGNQNTLIPKNTKFKAGKNTNGTDRYFITEEDHILNSAKVAELKTVNFIHDTVKSRNVSNSADGEGGEFSVNPKSWMAFGSDSDQLTAVGFCISSPFFNMKDGIKIISLLIKNVDLADFDIYISTKEGWQKLHGSINSGYWKLILPESIAEISPTNPKIHQTELSSIHPVLKFTVKDYRTDICEKYSNTVSDITVRVENTDFSSVTVQNDLGKIDPSKPFLPFGINPKKDVSALIIGHPFFFSKFSKSINIKAVGSSGTPTSAIQYLENGIWKNAKPGRYDREFQKEYTSTTRNNYIRYLYKGNYSREIYATGLVKEIKKILSQDVASDKISAENIPNWSELKLSASAEFSHSDSEVFQLYHLHPFGVEEKKESITVLPMYERASYFLIGISDFRYGKSLSLHFEMLEGSGSQDLNHPKISWGAISGDRLIPLSHSEISKDSTLNLAQSGIIKFALQADKFVANTSLNSDLIWLAALCRADEAAVSHLIEVIPQAFTAIYQIPSDGMVETVEFNTITKAEIPVTGVKKIVQPYRSAGGKMAEDKHSFITRSSEYLRHKGVSISIFDYERILLQQFPFLHLVKCIPHTNSTTEMAPGHVLVIVLPELNLNTVQNILQPKVSLGKRETIKNYLQKISSPFVKIEVKNPKYVEVLVKVNVTYKLPFAADKEHYNVILNQRIREYISPWLVTEDEIVFNRESYRNAYINFIEELEFVDNITAFVILVNGETVENKINAGTEDVIFTSALNHLITNDILC